MRRHRKGGAIALEPFTGRCAQTGASEPDLNFSGDFIIMSKQTTPAIKAPTYNPKSFQRDFTALAVQSPKKAAVMAGDWRARLENALIEAETATEMALQMATIGGSVLAFSTIQGYQQAKKDAMVKQWREQTPGTKVGDKSISYHAENVDKSPDKTSPFKEGKFSDPTTLGPVPWSLLILGVSGGVAWMARNTDQGVFARGIATGALANVMGELGSTAGRKMYTNKATKKDNGNGNN